MSPDPFTGQSVLIVPGLHGSGPDHWQSRWERRYPHWRRVEQEDWSVPDIAAWTERLGVVVLAASQPVLIAAHSFGCLAAAVVAARHPQRIAGILFVAPANPAKFGIASQLPQQRFSFPSRVVASDNDPWMPLALARDWAGRWGSALTVLFGAGHINADSGLGDWSEGLDLLAAIGFERELAGEEAEGIQE